MIGRSITEREAIERAFYFDDQEYEARQRGDVKEAECYMARAKIVRQAISVLFPDYTY